MQTLLLMTTLLAATDLTENDWCSVDGQQYFAFRPMASQDQGVAWYIRINDRSGKYDPTAFSGEYIRRSPNKVRLSLTRCFKPVISPSRQGIWWARHSGYANDHGRRRLLYAIDLELDSSPSGIIATASSGARIDEEGDSISEDSDDVKYAGEHIKIGMVFDLQPATRVSSEMQKFLRNNPPGLVGRTDWKQRAKVFPKSVMDSEKYLRDLYGWAYSRDNVKVSAQPKYCILSLHAQDKWDSGTSWLLSAERSSDGKISFSAVKGIFKFYGNKFEDQDVLMLYLGGTRIYEGEAIGSRIEWSMNTYRDLAALSIEIPQEDHLAPDPMTMYVESLDYVGPSGETISKYSSAGLFSLPERRYPLYFAGHGKADTLILRSGQPFGGSSVLEGQEETYLRILRESPPPGFRFRPTSIEHTAAKVPAGAKGNDSAAEDPANGYLRRGLDYCDAHDYVKAAAEFTKAIEISPRSASTNNSLAWLRATCPDNTVRNGRQALTLAKKACELTNYRDAACLDTLAAAHAETGDFANAVKWQKKAIALASEEQKSALLEHLVRFYEQKPIREP